MESPSKRVGLWLDRIEELMRLSGEELEEDLDALAQDMQIAAPDADLLARELARRSLTIPFLRQIVHGAAGRSPDEIARAPAAAGFVPWDEAVSTVESSSVSRHALPAGGDPPDEASSGSGRAAAAPRRLRTAERVLAGRTRSLTVVLDNFQNPLNASAVVRSCEALGLQEIHFCHERGRMKLASGIHKRCERWLDLAWHRTEDDALSVLRARGYRVYAADVTDDSVTVDELPLSPRLALVFGNEQAGVSKGFREGVDGFFHLPTTGFTAYLNVSNAVAMTVIALDRRMREARLRAPLAEQEILALRRAWYDTLARTPARRREYRQWLDAPPAPLPDEAARSRRHGER